MGKKNIPQERRGENLLQVKISGYTVLILHDSTYSKAESYSFLCRDSVSPLVRRVLFAHKQHIRLRCGPLEWHRWYLGRRGRTRLDGWSVAARGTFPSPTTAIWRVGSISKAVCTSRMRTVGSRGWRSGRRGTSWLIKGRPPTWSEARIAYSAIWGLRALLTVWAETKRRIGEEIVGSVMCTGMRK